MSLEGGEGGDGNNPSCDLEVMASYSDYGSSKSKFSCNNNNHDNNNNISNILYARQVFGAHVPVVNAYQRRGCRMAFNTDNLASRVAWNPKRIQNMILAVGPNTPASACWRDLTESDSEEEEDDDDDDDDDDDGEEDDNITGNWSSGESDMVDDAEGRAASRSDNNNDGGGGGGGDNDDENRNEDVMRFVAQAMEVASSDDGGGGRNEDAKDDDNDDDSDDSDDGDDDVNQQSHQQRSERLSERQEALRRLQRRILAAAQEELGVAGDSDEMMESDDDEMPFFRLRTNLSRTIRRPHMADNNQNRRPAKNWLPSIRHGGCINTACWLTSPWRLSSVNTMSASSAASSTFVDSEECPTQLITSGDDKLIKFWDVRNAMGTASPLPGGYDTFCPFASSETPQLNISKKWRNYYRRHSNEEEVKVAGGVTQLASIASGHRGNVFHVTPIDGKPGQVLSCGADGFLRLVDLQSEVSSVVIHPTVGDDFDDEYSFVINVGMAFSHQLLTSNTGLLCSERGLHHFDLRVSPREQQQQSLFQTSKNRIGARFRALCCKACAVWQPHGKDTESPYIFAGGAHEVVELFDLRMDGSRRKVIQRYKPQQLDGSGNVSISGIDVSKDGRELLVSYESDQIYTFPILPGAKSAAGPSLEEIESLTEFVSKDEELFMPELAAYGGHLNRFTFLKNPKYAGPNDEYICTGSDSGNAWIYERKTGAVAALLGADSNTCNGVIPHPSLPFFITYGIDSTAKLWRAATPVDPAIDDSPEGHTKKTTNFQHELSPVTRTWEGVQSQLKRFDKEPAVMPDFVATSEEIARSSHFSSRPYRGILGYYDSPRIGNMLRNLPMILRQNRYECYRSFHDERIESGPIDQPVIEFTHRVSIQRMKAQADRLGLKWNPLYPWVLQPPDDATIHPAELVPDYPSDWILFDKNMTTTPISPRMNFNTEDYAEILLQMFPGEAFTVNPQKESAVDTTPWLSEEQQSVDEYDESIWPLFDKQKPPPTDFVKRSRKLLYETIALLKEGGNVAMKESSFQKASRHYDKAIQYCAVALMRYLAGTTQLHHLTSGHHAIVGEKMEPSVSVLAVWSPLVRLLITTRLNMALLLLKPEFAMPSRAADQARAALKILAPFAQQEGKIVYVQRRKKHVIAKHEPKETFREARALQAKAYFRLGSAELEMADYSAAVKSFELSMKSSGSSSPNKKPDSLLVRRLHEARKKHKNKKKRDRKRFQRLMVDHDESSGNEESA